MRKQAKHWVWLLLFVLSACATATEELRPVANPPNLTGTWKGEWGGNMLHPIEFLIERQESGKLSGTMVIIDHGQRFPAGMTGRIGAKPDGNLWVVLDVEPGRYGPRQFTLRVVSEMRLEGEGWSSRHQGPVVLNRE